MDIIEKFLRQISYKFPKGYPDITNEQDMLMLEGILKKVGIELQEAPQISYDQLKPEAQKVADDVLQLLGLNKGQIKGTSGTQFIIYTDIPREILVQKVEDSGKFGSKRGDRADTRGNFKVGNVTFLFKPLKTSGEYYNLKPQTMGITLDKYVPISQIQQELIKGIQANKRIDDLQKKFLTALVTKKDNLSPEEKQTIFKDDRFYGEFLKNFGEIIGAIEFGLSKNANAIFFPGKGNYPLIDYLLKTDSGTIQVSAKTPKGQGNTVKLPDLIRLIQDTGNKPDPDLLKINDIINNNTLKVGTTELIRAYGDSNLKSKLEDFITKYPDYAERRLTSEETIERLELEREIVKQLNSQFSPMFTKAFNDYVDVVYIKYFPNKSTLEPEFKVIDEENFKVKLRTKNSPGHDSDKIGFDVSKA